MNIISKKPINKKFAAPMTLEERSNLEKLKDMLENEEIEYDENLHDNNTLLRFLRARELNIEKTFTMFKEFLKFRVDYKIDLIKVIRIII